MVDPAYITAERPRSHVGGPAWEVACLFPAQGDWSEDDYLALDTNRLVELVDGRLEVLPLPTLSHQTLAAFLHRRLNAFVNSRGLGEALFAPLPVRLCEKHYREPDVMLLRPEHIVERKYPELADLLMEVVGDDPESRKRDLVEKRAAYAAAGIPEYWIVDPEKQSVTVLSLDGKHYRVHGEFKAGSQASSVLLPGFCIDVAELFAEGKRS